MLKARTFLRTQGKGVLQAADDIATSKLEENYAVDLARVGIMWSGILELSGPIPASEVAAMLSCLDLVRATTLIDSESHWTRAAAHAAIAAYSDSSEAAVIEDDENQAQEKAAEIKDNPIGFSGSAETQQ
jgi:hypothetical protein